MNLMPLNFPYYYGRASEQYAFFRIPKLLITDSRFDGVSSDAKLLYGLLLDRMELSYRNGWVDDQNRVFIIFTVSGYAGHQPAIQRIQRDAGDGAEPGDHLHQQSGGVEPAGAQRQS